MADKRAELGLRGEQVAEKFLRGIRYRFLARRYRVAAGELDLVFDDDRTIVFVEVKTQRSAELLDPYERVNTPKRRKMVAAAKWFVAHKKLHDRPCRFDVVSVILPESGLPEVRHIANAFVPKSW